MVKKIHSLHINKLSGNQLKMIALVAMTCDHVGKELFPELMFLQVIGRLAYPIFAYMIAEGCRYTKDRRKHLLHIAGLAFLCQVVYFVVEGSLFQCILVTFSLAICVIYVIDYARRKQMNLPEAGAVPSDVNTKPMEAGAVSGDAGTKPGKRTVSFQVAAALSALAACMAVYFVSVMLPILLQGTDFYIDYGFWGILLPVCVYFAPERFRVPVLAAVLVPLCLELGGIQWYSLAAVALLALYSGKRGKTKMKNLFFVYYPVHLVVIFLLGIVF